MDFFRKPLIGVFSETPVNYTVYNAYWIPCSAKFVALGSCSSTDGIIQVYEMNEGKPELLHENIREKSSFKCGTFGASSLRTRHLATGDFLGNLNVWDLEHSKEPVYSVHQAHKNIIYEINGVAGNTPGCGAPELVTGGDDGLVKVWDPRQKDKPVAIMKSTDAVSRKCWTVAFGNSYNSQERVVAAGYDNGDVKLFDLKNMKMLWGTNLPNGVCCLEFDRPDIKMNKFLATCLESTYSLFIAKNRDEFPCITVNAHKSTIWCGRHLPQNREIFMTCGGSGSLSLWRYNNYTPADCENGPGYIRLLQESVVASQSIISYNWNSNKIGLAVCTSLDQVIRLVAVTQLNQFCQ